MELCWPAVVLIAALTMILVMGILGLSRSSDIEVSVKATCCTISVLFDDLLNGNVSSSGNFFIGMNGLTTQLD